MLDNKENVDRGGINENIYIYIYKGMQRGKTSDEFCARSYSSIHLESIKISVPREARFPSMFYARLVGSDTDPPYNYHITIMSTAFN